MRRVNPKPRIFYNLLLVMSLTLLAVSLGRLNLVEAARPAASEDAARQALTNTIRLQVVSARDGEGVAKGDPVDEYKFMINIDNTGNPFPEDDPACQPLLDNGDPNPDYPELCDWPSIRTVPGWAPIYYQGDQGDLNPVDGLNLPDGKYLISVMADGYKLDGEHFTVPLEEPAILHVELHPLPLPTASMVIKVFDDKSMTNGQFDAPVETGLAGFRASLNDTMGEITADIFENPLCTVYEKDENGEVNLDEDGEPVIETLGQGCYSDENGEIHIPNIGPLRYDVLVIPPDGEKWVQTTTLEGSQGWDTWLQEAGTGLDNEFIVAAEPFPWTIFGFVQPTPDLPPGEGAGSVTGVIMATSTYIPASGGLPYHGEVFGGMDGTKMVRPIKKPWLSLNDLQNGDTAIWVGQGNEDGSFRIDNVPPGNYFLSYWDEEQHFILDWVQLTVFPNEETDVGIRTMTGWFTEITGAVFFDYNENGKQDPGEPGVPDFPVILKDRDNTEIDRMSVMAITNGNGYYELPKAYPMGSWMFLEAFNELYRNTGVTFQTGNQPEETTILGNGATVGVLPILGQPGRLDWGVKFYEPHTNGGVQGTVFYDTVRAEDDARYAGVEPFQPGIPDLELRLYTAVRDENGDFVFETDGSYQKGHLVAVTTTETYTRPKNCVARDVDGEPVDFPVLPPSEGDYDCLEGPLMGTQFSHDFQEADGNYAIMELMYDPEDGSELDEPIPVPMGDYLLEVVIPNDASGRPMFQATREEDLNVFEGDTFIPQIPPPACAGPLHMVDVAGVGTDGYEALDMGNGIIVPASTPTHNPGFAEFGGSRFEGQPMPLCNVKLVTVTNGRAIAPSFNLFTEVPIPGKWKGYIIDDLNVSTNPYDLFFGEMAGVPFVPIGIYDYTGRLVHTIHSDKQGVYEVLLPSTQTFNAPTPSGTWANVYYIYGNDPGSLDGMNPYYNPQFRSIGTSFEIYPGVIVPSDLAPIWNGISIWSPTSQFNEAARCTLDGATPQLFAVSQPYVNGSGRITIHGLGFGETRGAGIVYLGNGRLEVVSWSDRTIVVDIPPDKDPGSYQLKIIADNGQSTINGLTIHVLGTGYNPAVYEVGVGKTFDPSDPKYTGDAAGPIQDAVMAAADAGGDALVVVYPGYQVPYFNPEGHYLENIVLYSPLKLQGVGPGGVYEDGSYVQGTIIDGRAVGADNVYTEWWREDLMPDIWENRGGWDGSIVDNEGNPRLYEGAVVTVVAEDAEFTSVYKASIDGFTIRGGDQQGFPNNLWQIGGGRKPGVNPEVVVQGGGVFLNGYARHMQITNNVIRSNGGAYAGAIRIGTPDVPEPYTDHQNDNLLIANNRILANGGANLAGAVGVFAGADNYEIAYNDFCGNFSAEYGGAISHYGYSPNGKIHDNRIYFNRSYDEGGGIMIAGQLPADFTQLSPGAGPVDIYSNLIHSNLASDDGGGIRFLMAGDFTYNVYNNFIVNNISTHEGGGISINDAPDVRIFNNTIMKNITTATAMTSNGFPAPAGLSTVRNSNLLQATLPGDAPIFSKPLIFNNIFWDNRAGTWTGDGVSGIGLEGDPFPTYHWDLGVADFSGVLEPSYTLLHEPYGPPNATNLIGLDPLVIEEYETSVRVFPWRGNPNFVGAEIVAVEMPPNLMGDYHLAPESPAVNAGAIRVQGIRCPTRDIDGDPRPSLGGCEMGADEIPVTLFPLSPILYSTTGVNQPTTNAGEEIEPAGDIRLYLPMLMTSAGALANNNWAGQTTQVNVEYGGVYPTESSILYWNAASFDRNQEVYFTFTKVGPTADKQGVLLKINGMSSTGSISDETSLIAVYFDATTTSISVDTLSPSQVWQRRTALNGIHFSEGDVFGARASEGGLVQIYKNGAVIGAIDLTTGPAPWAYSSTGGKIGVWFAAPDFSGTNRAAFDNFGGGTLP